MSEMVGIIGVNPSPYSRKLRAILRYRRIPHIWRLRRPGMGEDIESVRPALMPLMRLPGEARWRVDSTPLAYALEAGWTARSIIPPCPADAFLCHLIEDFADEWGTKWMFHHRWKQDDTAQEAALWIAQEMQLAPEATQLQAFARHFQDRQRSRMGLVGSSPETAPLIEQSYRRILGILANTLTGERFLFGSRPSLADFALYGQLIQLGTDLWPRQIMRELAPLLESWLALLDDASGVEGEWHADAASARAARSGILEMMGAEYLPFLQANARALEAGQATMEVTLRGQRYTQTPFPYQAKCYADILGRWRALDEAQRERIRPELDVAGCLGFLDS
ncbi:MAG: glutathione S-transferase C-terminal domain-containing protein [Alcanivorax sp.]|nr:glutathione S-transferase C-terminal domain-containing protein [Alcanivorax sp.]